MERWHIVSVMEAPQRIVRAVQEINLLLEYGMEPFAVSNPTEDIRVHYFKIFREGRPDIDWHSLDSSL